MRPAWLTLALVLWAAVLATAWITPPAGADEPGRAKAALQPELGPFIATGEVLPQPVRGASDDPEPEPAALLHAGPLDPNRTVTPEALTAHHGGSVAAPAHTPYAPRAPPLLVA